MASENTKLVIVESPSKIKTLKKFLGDNYIIESSVGHIRDLPKKDLGIDIENGFSTSYEVSPDSKKVVKNLKSIIKKADELYLATDPDREGEAISWHLVECLKPSIPIKRMVFNEITKEAIIDSFNNTRQIDVNLVRAQESRRILDRLFGFLVSKKLWLNVAGGLSAGRVQSPAVKILVDREKERSQFVENEYWSIEAIFKSESQPFDSILKSIDGKKIAVGNSFNKKTGKLDKEDVVLLNERSANDIVEGIDKCKWKVESLIVKPKNQNPYPPFITSTLQQEGIRKFRLSSQQVMSIAQKLYENGYITYMRTDSVNLSTEALNAAKNAIISLFGKEYLPNKFNYYKNKAKNAQEAHEAIRPSGSIFVHPNDLKTKLNDLEYKLYKMIWERTIASQMLPAKLELTTAKITNGKYNFESSGKVIKFKGFLKAYVESVDSKIEKLDSDENVLPQLIENQPLNSESFIAKKHLTKPISRFTEASLVKKMEELGIGRPSTYASIMKKIIDKGYVNKVNSSMVPSFTGYAIVQFLEKYFDELVNLDYTSKMENTLDEISLGEIDFKEYLDNFYFGKAKGLGLEKKLDQSFDKDKSRLIQIFDKEGVEIDLRIGRYGIYADKDGERVTVDSSLYPSDVTFTLINDLFKSKSKGDLEFCKNPKNNEPIYLKNGRFGPYVQCGKKMKSLLPNMSIDDVSEEIAIELVNLPKPIGKWNKNGSKINADIGKYGPYIKCGSESRSIPKNINLFQITELEANTLLDQDKKSRSVLNDFGDGILLKKGRYGDYVTNGKINATIPNSMDVDAISKEDAINLIKNKKEKDGK